MAEEQNTPLSLEGFSDILTSGFADVFSAGRAVAVGVSGGPDSMALAVLLSEWAAVNGGPDIHALIVDHGLRPDSAQEAEAACASLKRLSCVEPSVLKWAGEKPEAGLQEEARRARYGLMADYCAKKGISHLFLAHHRDDQAETFLFRLAKGSGLDGLAGMSAQQELGGIILCRPLLGVSKAQLIEVCDHYSVQCVHDPSNDSDSFARVRLRKSMGVLAEEGLSAKRLAVTASRLRRAREALEIIADKAFEQVLVKKDTRCIVLNYFTLKEWPEEVALRVVLRAVGELRSGEEHAPRMEKIESLFTDLMAATPFRKRTLGGLVFERDDAGGHIHIRKEI